MAKISAPDEFVYEAGFACAALRAASCAVFRAGGGAASRNARGTAHGAAANAAVSAAASAASISLHPEEVDQAFCRKDALALAVQSGKPFLAVHRLLRIAGSGKRTHSNNSDG